MKQLTVPFISSLRNESTMDEIAGQLTTLEEHPINIVPWPDGGPVPQAFFRIAHNDTAIFLQYRVREEAVRAVYLQSNDPVYRDSCVEFFLDIVGDGTYYNFEFNCIGTCLSAYGPAIRSERKYTPAEEIAKIRRGAFIKTEKEAHWELTAVIPVTAFIHQTITSLSGRICRGNFYKCGDDLPHPHYLAWNKISTAQPDFHQPGFFGTLLFQSA